jgi:hypothetical protein
MKSLLEKLNYKGEERIALLNCESSFMKLVGKDLKGVTIDSEIDPRFPYSFIIVFVRNKTDIDSMTPPVLHNLHSDGVLWFCYPRKTSTKNIPGIDRDHGWEALNESGFHGVRIVSVDNDWSALRFRNIKYIKSKSGRFDRK